MFDGEGAAYTAVMEGRVKPGQVMVIRYEGPRGRSVESCANHRPYLSEDPG